MTELKNVQPTDQTAERGCCDGCAGTGMSGDAAVPGGQCWDCRGTGHLHDGPCPEVSK